HPIFLRGKKQPPLRSAPRLARRSCNFTLGLPKEFFCDTVSHDVYLAFDEALRSFKELGAKTKEVSIPLLTATAHAGNQIAWADATHYHQQAGWFPARRADYGEDVRVRLETGTTVSAAAYLEALELRDKFIQQFHVVLADHGIDALVTPSTPIAAPLIGEETTAIGREGHPTRALLLRLNRPANLAALPALSAPCGFTSSGLAVGLQLIGAVTDEHLLLRIAHTF